MFTKKLFSSLVLITLMAGCDSSDGNKKELNPLLGEWKATCVADDSDLNDPESSVTSFEFTETEVIIKEVIYSDLICEEILVEINVSGTYDTGEIISTISGIEATEVDLQLTDANLSYVGGIDIDYDYDETSLPQLFVIEDTYLYLGLVLEDGIRPEDIDYSYSFELQE
jgi:hypothetical protein